MSFTPAIKFWCIIALQVAVILGIVVMKNVALTHGRDMLVQIQPVDPRDPFRGDYVTYQLSISRLTGAPVSAEYFEVGNIVYVPLRVQSVDATIGQPLVVLDETRPVTSRAPRDGSLFIRGRVTLSERTPDATSGEPPIEVQTGLRVVYDVEQYFIPEGSGRNFSFAGKNAVLHIVVGEYGDAMVKDLYVDGKKWNEQ